MRRGLFLTLITGLSILLLTATLLLYLYAVDIIVKQTQSRAFDAIARIQDALDETSDSFQDIAHRQSSGRAEQIIIVNSNFLLLANSLNPTGEVSGKYINADISDASEQSSATSAVRNRNDGTLLVSAAKRVRARSKELIVSVTYSIHQVASWSKAFLLWAIVLLLTITSLIVVIVIFSLRRYRRPIRTLLQNTEDASRSGINKITVHTGNSELTELVERFNSLVDHYDLLIESDNRKYSRINTLLSNLKTGILMVDANNVISLMNPKAELLLDIDRLDLFKKGKDASRQNQTVREILEQTRLVNENRLPRELSVTTLRGEILDISIEAVRNKYEPYEHSGALVMVRDVTEMRRLERLKDQFISNVSHELRTPLTAIGGFADTLKDWTALSRDERESAVEIIRLETERLKKLISDLLTLSKISNRMDHGTTELFDPAAVVAEVVRTLDAVAAEREITTRIFIAERIPPVTGTENWFRQIVVNLYENALKFSPHGGTVALSVSVKGDKVELMVEDSGPGIPESEREKVFERFYQINKSDTSKNAGTGLGLAIVKHMTDELGGTIEIVTSSLGGACVRLRIEK